MVNKNGHFYVGSTLNFIIVLPVTLPSRSIWYYLKCFNQIWLSILCTSSIFYTWSNQRRGASIRAIRTGYVGTECKQYSTNASSSAGRILLRGAQGQIAASRKNPLMSEETIARVSASHMGEKNGRLDKGTPVYLLEVLPSEFELCGTFPNRARASTILGIPASTLKN